MSLNEILVNRAHEEVDDDVPQLSAEALKALQEFYAESEAKAKQLDENWQLSQFWYDKNTSETLAKEVFFNAIEAFKDSKIKTYNVGCISCPTLFKYLHKYLKDLKEHPDIESFHDYIDRIGIKLFEYDKRFEIYGSDFIHYDYKHPLDIGTGLDNYFDMIISDPPYLSQECHIKTGMTVRKVGKQDFKLVVCTGAVMEDLLAASLKVKLNKFVPRHERNLANEFKCYSNYNTLFLDN